MVTPKFIIQTSAIKNLVPVFGDFKNLTKTFLGKIIVCGWVGVYVGVSMCVCVCGCVQC